MQERVIAEAAIAKEVLDDLREKSYIGWGYKIMFNRFLRMRKIAHRIRRGSASLEKLGTSKEELRELILNNCISHAKERLELLREKADPKLYKSLMEDVVVAGRIMAKTFHLSVGEAQALFLKEDLGINEDDLNCFAQKV